MSVLLRDKLTRGCSCQDIMHNFVQTMEDVEHDGLAKSYGSQEHPGKICKKIEHTFREDGSDRLMRRASSCCCIFFAYCLLYLPGTFSSL